MMEELACWNCTEAADAALGLERTILAGAAAEAEELTTGVALRQPGLPGAGVLNQLVVDPVAVRALGTECLLDDLDATFAGLGHRQAWVPDDDLGRALAGELAAAGFTARRDVVLVHDGRSLAADGAEAEHGPAAVARRRAARAVEQEVLRREGLRPRAITQLLVLRDALNAAVAVEHYVAEDAAHATTYAHDGVAKIGDLATVPRERGRGLARAVLELATARAHAAGHEHVVLVASPGSGDRELAARVGFEPAGAWWTFTRAAPAVLSRP